MLTPKSVSGLENHSTVPDNLRPQGRWVVSSQKISYIYPKAIVPKLGHTLGSSMDLWLVRSRLKLSRIGSNCSEVQPEHHGFLNLPKVILMCRQGGECTKSLPPMELTEMGY